jgi:hypothetical protein
MKPRKKCSVEWCNNPVFGRGWCTLHYKINYIAPRAKKKKTPIRSRSRGLMHRTQQYSLARKLFIEHERNNDPQKRIFCIFCGIVIPGEPDLHHGNGRRGKWLLDERYWFLAHRDCHSDYDRKSWRDLQWWSGYIERLLYSNILIYNKEIKRQEK